MVSGKKEFKKEESGDKETHRRPLHNSRHMRSMWNRTVAEGTERTQVSKQRDEGGEKSRMSPLS